MRVKKYLLLLLSVTIVTGVVLYSCTRKKVDYLGPEYLSAPSGFSASNFTVTPAAFTSTGGWTITADFSARVTYYVTITGLTSGAEKQYTGVGSNITASSIGGNWNGTHDGLYFFKTGEVVSVKLTFLRSDYYLEQLVILSAARDYFTLNPNIRPIGPAGNMSYEASIVNVVTNSSAFPLQFAFSEGLTGTAVGKTAERDLASAYGIKAVHGDYILRFSGMSGQPDGFFIGGIQHRAGFPATSFLLPVTWTDPTQIYFNVYVYGQGTDSKATVNLEFHESDASNPKNTQPGGKKECNTNNVLGAFSHDPCTDDGWVYAIPVNFTGWKLISAKYSDCTRSVSVPNGGNGDGVMEPGRLARLQMGVVATPAFANATVMFDYPVISYGAPFDPTK